MNEGFLLAATLAGDRHASIGRSALDRDPAEAFAAWYGGLTTDPEERRKRIAMITAQIKAPLVATAHTRTMPDRALALLAPLAQRGV